MHVNFWNQKLVQVYYQCLEFAITSHLNCLFLVILALKTMACFVALLNLALARLRLNPSLIGLVALHRLPMGPWLGIGNSTIAKTLTLWLLACTWLNTMFLLQLATTQHMHVWALYHSTLKGEQRCGGRQPLTYDTCKFVKVLATGFVFSMYVGCPHKISLRVDTRATKNILSKCLSRNIIQPCGSVPWQWTMSIIFSKAPRANENIHALFIHLGWT